MEVVDKGGVALQMRHPNDFITPSLLLDYFRVVALDGLESR